MGIYVPYGVILTPQRIIPAHNWPKHYKNGPNGLLDRIHRDTGQGT